MEKTKPLLSIIAFVSQIQPQERPSRNRTSMVLESGCSNLNTVHCKLYQDTLSGIG